MSLLHEIQTAVIQDGANLSSALLKLRLLAARLGSNPLEEWVKHESEGYPPDSEVPPYRVVPVSYRGTFTGTFGSRINNAQIPGYIVEEFAGKGWTRYEIRDGIAAINDLVRSTTLLEIDASNLILLFQGKVYKDYACNEVLGVISRPAMTELQYAVRSRTLFCAFLGRVLLLHIAAPREDLTAPPMGTGDLMAAFDRLGRARTVSPSARRIRRWQAFVMAGPRNGVPAKPS